MGFLAKFWDETVAGPAPAEPDIGKLRRYESAPAPARKVVPGDVMVSRSITVLRTNLGPRNLSVDTGSGGLDSPSGSTTPGTPPTPGTPVTPTGYIKNFTRRKSPVTGRTERAEPRNPTVYDWIIMSALDR